MFRAFFSSENQRELSPIRPAECQPDLTSTFAYSSFPLFSLSPPPNVPHNPPQIAPSFSKMPSHHLRVLSYYEGGGNSFFLLIISSFVMSKWGFWDLIVW